MQLVLFLISVENLPLRLLSDVFVVLNFFVEFFDFIDVLNYLEVVALLVFLLRF